MRYSFLFAALFFLSFSHPAARYSWDPWTRDRKASRPSSVSEKRNTHSLTNMREREQRVTTSRGVTLVLMFSSKWQCFTQTHWKVIHSLWVDLHATLPVHGSTFFLPFSHPAALFIVSTGHFASHSSTRKKIVRPRETEKENPNHCGEEERTHTHTHNTHTDTCTHACTQRGEKHNCNWFSILKRRGEWVGVRKCFMCVLIVEKRRKEREREKKSKAVTRKKRCLKSSRNGWKRVWWSRRECKTSWCTYSWSE